MESARSTSPRRKSSGSSRPRPDERMQSSSSTGSRHRLSRKDSVNDGLSRPHRDPTTSRRSTRDRNPFPSTNSTLEGLGDTNEEPEEWERGTTLEGGRKRKKKKDEPMSPIAVVGYVVFSYVIWQILTRSDETEILSHLPLHLQSLSSSHHSDLRSQPQSQYHLPYHLPQIPSPMPNTTGEPASASGTIFGIILYPFYLLVTIIATPFPLILNVLYILLQVVVTILYPITATFRILGRTFILAPFNVVSSAVTVFYPLYVFIAGVIGVGCVLGLGVGWAGKLFLDALFGRKRRSSGRKRSIVLPRLQAATSRSSQPGSPSQAFRRKALTPSSGEEREHIRTPKLYDHMIDVEDDENDVQYVSERHIGGSMRSKSSYGASRESPVVGLRQRGSRGSTSIR